MSSQKRDYYEILGIDKSASEREITKAFHKIAKKHHPDVNPDNPESEEIFKEANEAYSVLSDPEQKKKYDQFGHAGVNNSGYSGGSYQSWDDLNDIFEQFFGGFGGFGGGFSSSQASATGPQVGRDTHYSINIEFMEAAFGITREVEVQQLDNCEICKGSGATPGTSSDTCDVCNGSGVERRRVQSGFFTQVQTIQCTKCNGRGKIIPNPCEKCNGGGVVRKRKSLTVKIPAGINTGEVLTLREQGEPGKNGGPHGNMYLKINVKEHELFTRQGYDTYCEVPISYAQAALGEEVQIPTIDGEVTYDLKEGTQPGDVITIKNKGIPHVNRENSRGNHYVTIDVEVPTRLSNEQKDLLRAFDTSVTGKNYSKQENFFDKIKNLFNN